jgi:hypothetical protein
MPSGNLEELIVVQLVEIFPELVFPRYSDAHFGLHESENSPTSVIHIHLHKMEADIKYVYSNTNSKICIISIFIYLLISFAWQYFILYVRN